MNTHQSPSAREDIVCAVLEYLALHPHAADSAEGVARWWLVPRITAAQSDVEQVLDRLVDEGRLRRVRLADGTTLYSRNWNEDPTH